MRIHMKVTGLAAFLSIFALVVLWLLNNQSAGNPSFTSSDSNTASLTLSLNYDEMNEVRWNQDLLLLCKVTFIATEGSFSLSIHLKRWLSVTQQDLVTVVDLMFYACTESTIIRVLFIYARWYCMWNKHPANCFQKCDSKWNTGSNFQ